MANPVNVISDYDSYVQVSIGGSYSLYGNIQVDDEDGGTLSLTLSVDHGTLTVTDIDGLSSYDGNGTAFLELVGSEAEIDAALSGLVYGHDGLSYAADTLVISLADDADGSDYDTIAIGVYQYPPPNTAPTLLVPDTIAIEQGTSFELDGSIQVSDAEGDFLTLTLSVSHGTLTFEGGQGGAISYNGTSSVTVSGYEYEVNAELEHLVYENDGIYGEDDDYISLSVFDGYDSANDNVEVAVFGGPTITGTPGNDDGISNDALIGTDQSEIINGLGGNDVLAGLAGGDWLDGGEGSDTADFSLDAANGVPFQGEYATYLTGQYGVVVNLSGSSLYGEGGLAPGGAFDGFGDRDTLVSIENVIGTAFGDRLFGSDEANVLDGRGGYDRLVGNGGADTLIGGDGYDVVDYQVEYDQATYGSEGTFFGVIVNLSDNDYELTPEQADLTARAPALVIAAHTARDVRDDVDTLVGIETVVGTSLDDLFWGGDDQDNNFTGGDGRDAFIGSAGSDFSSTVDYNPERGEFGIFDADGLEQTPEQTNWGIVVNLSGNAIGRSTPGLTAWFDSGDAPLIGELGPGQAIDSFGDIDSLTGIDSVTGTYRDDIFVGDDSDFGNYFTGLDGADAYWGGGGQDQVSFAWENGGQGVVVNLSGWIYDVSAGVLVDPGDPSYVPGEGDLQSGQGTDTFGNLETFDSIETLRGSQWNDRFYGGGENNILLGLAGADSLDGGDGRDLVRYDRDADNGGFAHGVVVNLSADPYESQLFAGVTVAAHTARDGFETTDTLTSIEDARGSAFADELIGDEGRNELDGRDGDDLILGDGGNDRLIGGAGADTLDGGDGYDTVDYRREQNVNGGGGFGVVVNLSGAALQLTQDQWTATGRSLPDGFDPQTDTLAVDAHTARDNTDDVDQVVAVERVHGTSYADVFKGADDQDNEFVGFAGGDAFIGGESEDFGDNVDYGAEEGEFGLLKVDGTATAYLGVVVNLSDYVLTDAYYFAEIGPLDAHSAIDSYGDIDTLASIDGVSGTVRDDFFVGDDLANYFYGGNGADLYRGGGGTDQVSFNGEDGGQGARVNLTDADIGDLDAHSGRDTWGNLETLDSIERLRGSRYADTFYGGGEDNIFAGMAGGDAFDGGEGRDQVRYDREIDEGGTRGVTVNLGSGNFVSGIGNFTVAAETARDAFGDTDTLTSIEDARGTELADELVGSDEANRLEGRGGNDKLIGNLGDDDIEGGGGGDTIFGDYNDIGPGGVTGGRDYIDAGRGNDAVYAGGGDDYIRGGAEGDGNGNGGHDTVDGGIGYDVLGFHDSLDEDDGEPIGGVTVALTAGVAGAGTVTGEIADGAVDTSFVNLERVEGTEGDDIFTAGKGIAFTDDAEYTFGGDAPGRAFAFVGGAGDDSFTDDSGTPTGVIQINYDAEKFTRGESGEIWGDDEGEYGVIVNANTAPGDTTVQSGYIFGADGPIVLQAGQARDTFGDTDTFVGVKSFRLTDATDLFIGGSGVAYVEGRGGNDGFIGGSGAEEFHGGAGADDIQAGGGDDRLFAGQSGEADIDADTLDGGDGFDIAVYEGSINDYEITQDAGNVYVTRDGVTDTLTDVERIEFDDGFWPPENQNAAPTAVADTGSAGENETKAFDVLVNDTDPDAGDTLSLVSIGTVGVASAVGAVNGLDAAAAFSIVGGQIQFAPGTRFDALNVGQSATVTVGYTMQDALGLQSASTLTLTVNGTNDGPRLIADAATLNEAATKTGNALTNDSDPEGGLLTVRGVKLQGGGATAQPGATLAGLYGTLTIAANGAYTYVANELLPLAIGLTFVETFVVTVGDPANATSEETLSFTVADLGKVLVNAVGEQFGTLFSDSMTGNGGVNRMRGYGGSDYIDGAAGADDIYGEDGTDTLLGGTGNDNVVGGNGNDNARGGADNDKVWGDAGDDFLFGDAGDETLYGGIGNDTMDGGTGVDRLYGNDGNDQMALGDGNDFGWGDAGNDTIHGNIGNDQINGGANDDTIYGDDGDDKLFGDDGNDILRGGIGTDQLTGGLGSDTLYFQPGTDTAWGGKGGDDFYVDTDFGKAVIKDFTSTATAAAKHDFADDIVLHTSMFANYDAVKAVMKQSGSNVVITAPGAGHTITIEGIKLAQLSAADFDFIV